MSQINVLLIENQYLQFKTIRRRLTELHDADYSVFPELLASGTDDLRQFKVFMNQVRIALNGRYGKARCKDALAEVIKYVKSKTPDILIIDHKLVGHEEALTGIDLAIELYEAGCVQPVLFLSRTPESKRSVIESLDGYINNSDWLYKGYSDHELLDSSYFKMKVHPAIEKLLAKVKAKAEQETVGLTLSNLFVENDVTEVLGTVKTEHYKKAILTIKHLTVEETKAINDFKADWRNPDAGKINHFFKVTLTNIIKRNGK